MSDLSLAGMETLIRTYFDGCNEADQRKMMNCFVSDAVHYFPPGMYGGPFVGSSTIAQRWATAVATGGSAWTVDSFVGDAARGEAVIEWSHFKQYAGTVLRGVEWYEFDHGSGLIREIRAYYASPQDSNLTTLELGGFDYAGRGWPSQPPAEHRHSPPELSD